MLPKKQIKWTPKFNSTAFKHMVSIYLNDPSPLYAPIFIKLLAEGYITLANMIVGRELKKPTPPYVFKLTDKGIQLLYATLTKNFRFVKCNRCEQAYLKLINDDASIIKNTHLTKSI